MSRGCNDLVTKDRLALSRSTPIFPAMTWTDAPTDSRCEATITLRDKSTAQCGRRRVLCERFCWQHLPKENIKKWEAQGWIATTEEK